jgi:hypothetical protein
MSFTGLSVRCVQVIALFTAQFVWQGGAAAQQPRTEAAGGTRSGDAYVRFDARRQQWTFGTEGAERTVTLAGGIFRMTSLREVRTPHEYVPTSAQSDEFRVVVDGKAVTGASGGWILAATDVSVLPQGEISLVIALDGHSLRVEQTYVVYPGSSIVRQWTRYQNATSGPLVITDPHFLASRVPLDDSSGLTLLYMTGGGYQTGSQMLKKVPFTSTYSRTFDSADPAEVTEVAGASYGYALSTGAGAYMQWFGVTRDSGAGGLYVGFDYWGRWAADLGRFHGTNGHLGIRVAGFRKELQAGESILTPKAFTGVFHGADLDTMGNELKTWQYRYLWDYTSDEYFSKIRFTAQMRWQFGKGEVIVGGGTQDNWDYREAMLFHAVNVMREIGADILWQDAGWHNLLGDNDGPDFAAVKDYLDAHGMGFAVWWQLYTVASRSEAYQEHPDWLTEPGAGQSNLDTSRSEVVDYLLAEIGEKVRLWGDFQWRLDGTPVVPVGKDETPMLEQHHKVFGLFETFRRRHPHSSIDICAGGGNLMGFETLRMADKSQLTDGGPMHISNYYSSYLFPPDKFDDWTRVGNFNWRHARSSLALSPSWTGDRGLYGHEPGLLLNDGLENVRRNFETYRYLLSKGVTGRWSLVYHPRVEGDDPVYYIQRQSADGLRGVVILKRFTNGTATVFPKGLRPEETYDVRFAASHRVLSRSGADLMQSGVRLTKPAPGELIFIGLPNHPGSGLDETPPREPRNVRKRVGTHLGRSGVEVIWEAPSDDNWLSYHQVYRDDEPLAKVAKGTFYFDWESGASGLDRRYEVRAVDGNGNSSGRVAATRVEGARIVFTARAGFLAGRDYSHQGENSWTYEEWSGTARTPLTWDGELGQMGLYRGSRGSGGSPVLVGASWMKPGESTDAVRTFTVPHSGSITVRGRVHKDLYHRYGNGVRVKLLKNDQQLWPAEGWQELAGGDTVGLDMNAVVSVTRGDRLHFVVNGRDSSLDDDTVWNPVITYDTLERAPKWRPRTELDNTSTRLAYSGSWHRLGGSPWASDLDQGYLPGWHRGTLSVSKTPGDKLVVRFKGTGIQIFGQTGSNNGIAKILLDGKPVATIDTFTPQVVYGWTSALTDLRNAAQWGPNPPTCLWHVAGLEPGEHELEIEVTGTKNAESTDTRIGIDAVVTIDGEVMKSEPGKRRP